MTEYQDVRSQCAEIRRELAALLSLGLFQEIGEELPVLPLGSPILQRRAGYREVLR